MPNTSNSTYKRKRKPTPKRQHAYRALAITWSILWFMLKMAIMMAIGMVVMLLFTVGSMTRGAGN